MARSIVIYIWALAMLVGMLGYTASRGWVEPTSIPGLRIAKVNETQHRQTLWFFGSSNCPCSRVSFEAFQSLLESEVGSDDELAWSVKLVEVVRSGETASPRFQLDARLSGLRSEYVWDDGSLAERMGVRTSGQIIIIGTDGQTLFQGGITPARGHPGPCHGLEQARRAIRAGTPTGVAPVFGCVLPEPAGRSGNAVADPREGGRS